MKTEITQESLLAYGMTKVSDPGVSMEKVLGESSDVGSIAIQVTHYRNVPELTLYLPDGALIYLNIHSIEELQAFEKAIHIYEPNN